LPAYISAGPRSSAFFHTTLDSSPSAPPRSHLAETPRSRDVGPAWAKIDKDQLIWRHRYCSTCFGRPVHLTNGPLAGVSEERCELHPPTGVSLSWAMTQKWLGFAVIATSSLRIPRLSPLGWASISMYIPGLRLYGRSALPSSFQAECLAARDGQRSMWRSTMTPTVDCRRICYSLKAATILSECELPLFNCCLTASIPPLIESLHSGLTPLDISWTLLTSVYSNGCDFSRRHCFLPRPSSGI